MERRAFVLRVKPMFMDAYLEAHAEVWPELLEAFRNAGIENFTIFRHGNQMFGYYESWDMAAAVARMDSLEITALWQAAMADFLEEPVAERGAASLEEIFRFD